MKPSVAIFLAFFGFSSHSTAQFLFDDAPTRRGSVNPNSGTLEGIVMEKKIGATPDAKDVTITFILSKEPSAFFDYYDENLKGVVIDIYDMNLGESPIDSLKEYPITTTKVENVEVDLNKDVSGLKPDIREVVRIIFPSKYNFEYEIMEEFGVISLNFHWDKKTEKKLKRAGTAVYWQVPLAAVVAGGAGFGAWWVWFKPKDPTVHCPICAVDDPPALPN